eukprot:m.43829 g.43829  ORF g.43829 m.43829 type:complete len:199 (-) comp10799_c0_seq1:307-903(-)
MAPLIVGIQGPTCCGKSTLVKGLSAKHTNVEILAQDSYYHPEPTKFVHVRGHHTPDFDHPDSVNYDELVQDLQYKHQNMPSDMVLVLEGTMLSSRKEVRELVDVWIFLNSDKDLCASRRAQRSYELYPDVHGYFDDHAWPAVMQLTWHSIKEFLLTRECDRQTGKSHLKANAKVYLTCADVAKEQLLTQVSGLIGLSN